MRRYLETIHERSETHKKRFALVVSLSITLLIFGVWSMTRINDSKEILADGEAPSIEVSPFESLTASIGTAIKAIRGNLDNIEVGLETVHKYERE